MKTETLVKVDHFKKLLDIWAATEVHTLKQDLRDVLIRELPFLLATDKKDVYRKLFKEKGRIPAIKACRPDFGGSLKDAKNYIDDLCSDLIPGGINV